MPSANVYLVADYNLQEKTTTTYRLLVGDGVQGWLTDIKNMTIGPLWFPKYGIRSHDVNDPAATLKVASFASLGQTGLTAVYGSATPVFPIEVVAIIDYRGSPWSPSGTDSSMDVSTRKPGLPPPYMEVELDYRFPAPVEFNATIHVDQHAPWNDDGCGHLFQLVGAVMVLSPRVDSIVADGVVTGITYQWHVTGAQVIGGKVDVSTDNQPLTLSLDTPGTVVVTLQVVVTSNVGAGGVNSVTETGTQTKDYRVEVLTGAEAAMAAALCKLRQETLPIPRMVFPGDPAKVRSLPEVAQRLRELRGRFEASTAVFVERLSQVISEYDKTRF